MKIFSKKEKIANTDIDISISILDMPFAKYLSNLFLDQDSAIMNDFIYVFFPVLSITVLMFSLRSIFLDPYTPKIKKQQLF